MMRTIKTLSVIALLLTGCSFAPHYATPEIEGADLFKGTAGYEAHWKTAAPFAGQVDKGEWWKIYNDARLDALEQQAIANNPELQAAAARIEQASASLARVRSRLFPTVTGNAGVTIQDLGANEKPTHDYNIFGSVSYGVDLFGRVRAASRAANFDKEQVQALHDQVLLLIQADIARNYFVLSALDEEIALLQKTVTLREDSLSLVEKRFKEGEENEQNSLRAKADLATTRAELASTQQQRSLVEHAMAILLGQAPSQFTIEAQILPEATPSIPAGLPSEILERRPDIAAAQFDMAAANERIGLARAAFFPSISLTGQGGFSSPDLGGIFNWSNRAWAFGPLVTLPIFEGGSRIADLKLSKADFQESVANYRQKVLVAFREVEDSLSSLRSLAERLDQLQQASMAAEKAAKISEMRYHEGEAAYIEVLDTQRDLLATQRALAQTRGDIFVATTGLIRSLGGGWSGHEVNTAN